MNIKKQDLENIYRFLDKLAFKGAVSRPVTKLKHAIQETLSELRADEVELVEENKGKIDDNGRVSFPSTELKLSFATAQQELRQELAIYTETTKGQFKRLTESLNNYDQELQGSDADAYDTLLDALEAEEKTHEN